MKIIIDHICMDKIWNTETKFKKRRKYITRTSQHKLMNSQSHKYICSILGNGRLWIRNVNVVAFKTVQKKTHHNQLLLFFCTCTHKMTYSWLRSLSHRIQNGSDWNKTLTCYCVQHQIWKLWKEHYFRSLESKSTSYFEV